MGTLLRTGLGGWGKEGGHCHGDTSENRAWGVGEGGGTGLTRSPHTSMCLAHPGGVGGGRGYYHGDTSENSSHGSTDIALTPGPLTFDMDIGGPGSRWHMTLDTP